MSTSRKLSSVHACMQKSPRAVSESHVNDGSVCQSALTCQSSAQAAASHVLAIIAELALETQRQLGLAGLSERCGARRVEDVVQLHGKTKNIGRVRIDVRMPHLRQQEHRISRKRATGGTSDINGAWDSDLVYR